MQKRLVLCLDGTWNSTFIPVEREDGTQVLKPTNPLKIARSVLPVGSDQVAQLTYYDSGVGALGLYPGLSNKLLNLADSKLGGAWGAGFEANVEQAANFLALNYREGDPVFVFGFSRGAAQARGLTNFLNWLGGITPKNDAYYLPLLFKHYVESKGEGDPRDVKDSEDYVPADHLTPLRITFLGVFDTVMALGSRLRASANNSTEERSFFVRETPASCVDHARQAIAIDEARYDFRAEIWRAKDAQTQTLEQRWFAGVHGNVGGSYGQDGLANCALQWIVGEAQGLGLQCNTTFLKNYRAFPQHRMGVSNTGLYKFIDAVRFRRGKGQRPLVLDQGAANISVDPTAIKRLCSDHRKFDHMDEPYRPRSLVELARQFKSQPDEWLRSYGIDPATYPFPSDI